MKGIIYSLVVTVVDLGEGPMVSYGIRCLRNGVELASFPDILPDRKKVEELVAKCNESDLSPLHFLDVVEDFLVCCSSF